MFPTLSECVGRVEPIDDIARLEALHAWLTARDDAALCVGCSGTERRASLRVHGRTYQAVATGGGFAAQWSAIVETISQAERFEERAGLGLG